MNELLTKSNRIILLTICMFLILSLFGFFFLRQGQGGSTLYLLMVLIGIIGIIGGPITALSVTLFLFFLIGSSILWLSISDSTPFINDIPFIYILIWMASLLVISIVCGRLSNQVKALNQANTLLQEQMRTLVAVDPITGFDNKDRLFLELEMEFNRSKRYGTTFSLLLLKMQHFDQFSKLYGERETEGILRHISKSLHDSTRLSDQKFRLEKDVFALILTETSMERIPTVIDRIDKKVNLFQLQNKKYVTLTFSYGYTDYQSEMKSHETMFESVKEQVSFHVS